MVASGATVEQISEAVARLKSKPSFKQAESDLGFAALCVVGTMSRQRRRWDDNAGAHPTRLVVTTGDPAKAVDTYNRGVHSVDGIYHTLAYVWTQSRVHGERLRAWIEEQLRAEPMINGWSDIEPWQFEMMIGMAADALKFDVFDEQERLRRVLARARTIMRG